MREILFRGKRVDNGEWILGGYAKCNNRHYILPDIDLIRGEWVFKNIEVVPETVGQFTGLTDKNGKKIFEGDICGCFCNTQIFEVKYCKERCGYFFDDCVRSGDCEPAPECLGNLRDTIEVIGNIHDKPELFGAGLMSALKGAGVYHRGSINDETLPKPTEMVNAAVAQIERNMEMDTAHAQSLFQMMNGTHYLRW